MEAESDSPTAKKTTRRKNKAQEAGLVIQHKANLKKARVSEKWLRRVLTTTVRKSFTPRMKETHKNPDTTVERVP